MSSYVYTQVSEATHLDQILALQAQNTKAQHTEEVWREQGFVTCRHDRALLQQMNEPHPHVIALYGGEVVAYALVMDIKWRHSLEVLVSMFDMIDRQQWSGRHLSEGRYIVMGQICVAEEHRGKGVFRGLYEYYRSCLKPYFDYCITEVALDNQRSLNAHTSV